MIASLLNYLKPKVQYDDPLTAQRAQGLLIYLAIGFVVASFAAIYQLTNTFSDFANISVTALALVNIFSPIVVGVLFVAVRRGHHRLGAIGIVAFSILALLNFWSSSIDTVAILAFTIPLVAAGMLLGWRSVFIVFACLIAIATGPTFINPVEGATTTAFFVLLLILSIISTMLVVFGTNIQFTASRIMGDLERLQQILHTTLETREAQDENQAITRTINIIRDELGYTFVRIYLVDNGEVTQRVQSGLNLDQVAIDANVEISNGSGIYEAIRRKAAVSIIETDDAVLRQHLLRGTQAALAVPIVTTDDTVIGVIDVQLEDQKTFSPVEIQTLNLVATQLGQTMEHNRIIANLREDLSEQDALIARQRTRLLQFERAERQTTTESWRDYLEQRGVEYMGFDILDPTSQPVAGFDLFPDMESAIQTGDISVTDNGEHQIVSVPISLRGQSLGAMSFKVPKGGQAFGVRQQELVRNVVQRLSLALENKRLFEQSQAQAKRESKANEVGNLLLSTTDVDTVLQLAVDNFNEALGAVQTQIRLKPEAQRANEGEKNQ